MGVGKRDERRKKRVVSDTPVKFGAYTPL